MTYTPYVIPKFGGLRLDADPQEVGAQNAVDMLNADLDKQGRARTRDGTTDFSSTTNASASFVGDLVAANLGADMLVALGDDGTNTIKLSKISTAGSITNVGTINATATLASTALFGSPTSDLLFVATRGNVIAGHSLGAAKTLKTFDGTSIASGTGSPRFIAVSPLSNRLVQAGFASAGSSPTTANGSPYTVFWSDAGDPAAYSANNFVHFSPGDGYPIEAVETWRDGTYVFKSNAFYVVYSESVDGDGNPIFNNRRVDIEGYLYRSYQTSSVCAGSDALYYATTRGVYRTNGGPGQLISQAISPVFTDSGSSLRLGTLQSLSFGKGRLFMTYVTTGSVERTLVYDPQTGDWMLWSLPTQLSRVVDWQLNQSKVQGSSELIYFLSGNKVMFLDSTTTTDDGVALPSSYTSGCYELGEPGLQTDTRWTRGWGYGAPTLSVFTDQGSTDANAGTLTLGTAPAVAHGYRQQSYTGQLFQHKLSATSGAWGVSRLQHDIAWSR